MQFIDLSVVLENDKKWAPWWARNKVKNQDHKFGRLAIWILFHLKSKYLLNGLGWANDEITFSTHGTTHLDAPWHYGPLSEGKPAKTIDLIPLEWCYSDGVIIDMCHKKHGEGITEDDIKSFLQKINYKIKPMDIVLIKTGNDKMLGTKDYFDHGSGVTKEATHWILNQGVKITGIDSWGWDIPLKIQAEQAKKTKRSDIFWQAHFVGIEKEYCHLERLTNLDKLPPFGFKIICFPLKVKNGSAGPARVVAIIEKCL